MVKKAECAASLDMSARKYTEDFQACWQIKKKKKKRGAGYYLQPKAPEYFPYADKETKMCVFKVKKAAY